MLAFDLVVALWATVAPLRVLFGLERRYVFRVVVLFLAWSGCQCPVAGLDAGGLIPAERVKRSLKILTHEVTVYFRNPALRESGVLPLGGIARFYGTATLHNAGPIRDEVWDRMVEPEKERDPNGIVEHNLDTTAFEVSSQWVGDVRFVTYAVPGETP